ncbi:MAG: prepilin-type N-terminal cleavage/methylation domain-containing protein [Patescibacteria group bacterium]
MYNFRKTKKNNKENNQGFTLVESLVAISIFTLALVGMMVSLGEGLADTGYAKEKLIAEYLAQENIEYIRNMRDTYLLYSASPSAGWTSFLTKVSPCTSTDRSKSCYFDDQGLDFGSSAVMPMTNLTLTACSGACPYLKYNNTTGKYGYDASGVLTGLKRWFIITQTPGDETMRVYSFVSWPQNSATHTVTFSEDLRSWGE